MLNNQRFTPENLFELITKISLYRFWVLLFECFLPSVIHRRRFKDRNLIFHFCNLVIEAEHKNVEIDEQHHSQNAQKCIKQLNFLEFIVFPVNLHFNHLSAIINFACRNLVTFVSFIPSSRFFGDKLTFCRKNAVLFYFRFRSHNIKL